MNKVRTKIFVGLFFVLSMLLAKLTAFVTTTMHNQYGAASLRYAHQHGYHGSTGMQCSFGGRSSGRNKQGWRRNVLQMYDDVQSAVDAYAAGKTPDVQERFDASAQGGRLRAVGHLDTDKRGHVRMSGRFSEQRALFFAGLPVYRHYDYGQWLVSVHIPVVRKYVDAISFKDLTSTAPGGGHAHNLLVIDNLTKGGKLAEAMKTWGNLDLSPWHGLGLGDISFLARWQQVWSVPLNHIDNLSTHVNLGISLPTAKKKDEDKAFSMSLGNDGAWAIPLSFGGSCELKHGVHLGVDANFSFLLSTARERRMKTDLRQTEFLLLNKGDVVKKYGLIWSLEASAQWRHFFKGLSCSATYQFQGHSHDELKPRDTQLFPAAIANAARGLRGWRLHNMHVQLGYDHVEVVPKSGEEQSRMSQLLSNVRSWLWGEAVVDEGEYSVIQKEPISYHAAIFYTLPFSARNVIDGHVVGAQVMVTF